MKHTILTVSALVLALSGSAALAQNAPKGGGGEAAPAGNPGGGESMKPPEGGAQPGVRPGGASPGMKAGPAAAAQPTAGERQPGENAGGAPGAQPKAAQAPSGAPRAGEPGKAQPPGGAKPGAESAGQPRPAGQAARRPAPNLSEQQRTRVHDDFRHLDVRPVHVDFDVNIGAAVPHAVALRALPREIVTIVPEYEGYEFFRTPTSIVIVDPDTLEVVAILPV